MAPGQRTSSWFGWTGLLLLGLLLGACAEPSTADPSADQTISSEGTTSPVEGATTTAPPDGTSPAVPASCEPVVDGVGWRSDDVVTLELIDEIDGKEVFAAEYPLPGPTDGLWSQWGQGVVAGGVHYSAVGDHLGADGNSYFFHYDPTSKALTRFMDVDSVVDVSDDTWGFGKIHAQMAADECGRIWAATYWGTRRDIENYEGDHLLVIDPSSETVADRGVVAEGRGVPSMVMSADGTTLVFEAVDPESDTGTLVAWDLGSVSPISEYEDEDHTGFRALGLGADGSVLYSVWDGELRGWDPTTDTVTTVTQDMPGEWMRAVTPNTEDGTIFAVSDDEPFLFSLDSSGSVKDLGDPGGYTTSLALDQTSQTLYWMPEAHGGAWELGAPIMKLDIQTGEISEVLALADSFEDELGLLPGGTFSIVLEDGKLFIGINASPLDDDSGFGTVVLVVIEGL